MGFIDNLKNIQPLQFNESLINNSDTIVNSMVVNANDTTGGLWFVVSIMVLFFFLMYVFMDRQRDFKYDFPRALFISSSWCLIVSAVAAITGLSVTIIPIVWFSTLFFFSGLAVMGRKQKNI